MGKFIEDANVNRKASRIALWVIGGCVILGLLIKNGALAPEGINNFVLTIVGWVIFAFGAGWLIEDFRKGIKDTIKEAIDEKNKGV